MNLCEQKFILCMLKSWIIHQLCKSSFWLEKSTIGFEQGCKVMPYPYLKITTIIGWLVGVFLGVEWLVVFFGLNGWLLFFFG